MYSCKVKVVPGKSLRLATRVTVADTTVETAANPAIPCFRSSLSTEHTSLRRDLLEDGLFTTIGMQVLFCVAPMHPKYEAYEAMVYDALPTKKVPRHLVGDVAYLQLNDIVMVHPRDQMFHLLNGNRHEGIGYHFGSNFEKCISHLLEGTLLSL